jgi:hypothetical protein
MAKEQEQARAIVNLVNSLNLKFEVLDLLDPEPPYDLFIV